MFNIISNATRSTMPFVSAACFAGGIFTLRKFCLAGSYKIGASVIGLIGKQNAAIEWNKTSDDYWTLAKKDSFRDLTATTGLLAACLIAKYAGPELMIQGETKKVEDVKKEPSLFEHYPILNTLWDYKRTALMLTLGTAGTAVLVFKSRIFSSCRHSLIKEKINLNVEIDLGDSIPLHPEMMRFLLMRGLGQVL